MRRNVWSEEERPTRDAMLKIRDGAVMIKDVEEHGLTIERQGFYVLIDGACYCVTVEKVGP